MRGENDRSIRAKLTIACSMKGQKGLVPGDLGGGSGGLWIHCNSNIRRFETLGAKATVVVAYIAGNGWYR